MVFGVLKFIGYNLKELFGNFFEKLGFRFSYVGLGADVLEVKVF